MESSRFEAHLEIDEVLKELGRELRKLVDGKFESDRRGFRLKKKLVIRLLRELLHDVEHIPFRG